MIYAWVIGSFIIGFLGAGRKIGFFGAFLLSLVLSPVIGAIFTATSPQDQATNPDEQKALFQSLLNGEITADEYHKRVEKLKK